MKRNEGKNTKVVMRRVGLRIEMLSMFRNPVSVCDPVGCK